MLPPPPPICAARAARKERRHRCCCQQDLKQGAKLVSWRAFKRLGFFSQHRQDELLALGFVRKPAYSRASLARMLTKRAELSSTCTRSVLSQMLAQPVCHKTTLIGATTTAPGMLKTRRARRIGTQRKHLSCLLSERYVRLLQLARPQTTAAAAQNNPPNLPINESHTKVFCERLDASGKIQHFRNRRHAQMNAQILMNTAAS